MKTSLITHSRLLLATDFIFILFKNHDRSEKKVVCENNNKKKIRFFSPICIISSDYTKSALVHFQTIDRTFHYYNLVAEWFSFADFSFHAPHHHCKQFREV